MRGARCELREGGNSATPVASKLGSYMLGENR